MSDKAFKKNIIITRLLFALVICAGLISTLVTIRSNSQSYINLEDKWSISYNNNKAEDICLTDYQFDMVNKNDKILLSRRLDKVDISQPALLLKTYHSTINVRLDGELIYSFGVEKNKENKAVGSGEFVISLPHNYYGKIIEIQLDITENNAFPSMENIYIIDEGKYTSSIFTSMFVELITGSMIIVMGLIAIMAALIQSCFKQFNKRILSTGLLMFFVGCWILARYNILNIFIHSKSIVSFVEYSSLYLCIPSIALMFYDLQKKAFAKRITMALIVLSSILSIVSIILEIIGSAHMVSMLTYMQALGIGVIVFSLVIMFIEFRSMSKSDKMLIHGCIILILAVVVEMIRFNVEKYVFEQSDGRSYIVVGILLFTVIIVSSYFMYSKEYINLSVEKRTLVDMAYKDMLTGLSNRTAVMDMVDNMERLKISEFSIFNFDLNNLKKVNDSLGHLAGDKYLCIFADILKEYFDEFDVVGRVGGDEFVAVINKACNEEDVKRKIKKMETILENKTEEELNTKLSFAYGYAISNKKHTIGVLEAYDKADGEMYECKREQKQN